jgi:hypothetical protein
MRSCMPRPTPMLQMHTVVEQPLTFSGTGSISCRPLGQEPIEFTWLTPDGTTPQLENSDSEAKNLGPGRYRITAVDANGSEALVLVEIKPMFSSAVCIEGYRISPASTTFSRDGSVEILGTGIEGFRYLWTNGTETDGCVLKDVPCGTYAAVPLPLSGKTPVLVHSTKPAKVDVAPSGRWG